MPIGLAVLFFDVCDKAICNKKSSTISQLVHSLRSLGNLVGLLKKKKKKKMEQIMVRLNRNPQKTRCREGGCGRLLHTVNSTSQCLLVSPVFGTVSSLHPTSFLMIFYIYLYIYR